MAKIEANKLVAKKAVVQRKPKDYEAELERIHNLKALEDSINNGSFMGVALPETNGRPLLEKKRGGEKLLKHRTTLKIPMPVMRKLNIKLAEKNAFLEDYILQLIYKDLSLPFNWTGDDREL